MKPYTPEANVLLLISPNQSLRNFKVKINCKELTRILERPLIVNCIFSILFFFRLGVLNLSLGREVGKNVDKMFVSDDALSYYSSDLVNFLET